MFTIAITRSRFGSTITTYGGTFADADTAGAAAVRMLDAGLLDGLFDVDVVLVPDDVTPSPIAADYL